MTSTLTTRPKAQSAARTPKLLTGTPDLPAHFNRFGPLPSLGAALLPLLEEAGLTGRGGAGFPTARKMRVVAQGRGSRVVVANGTEGEPLSAKDKALLLQSPHLVLDGLDLAAQAVGANRRIICMEKGRPDICRSIAAALAERGPRAQGVEIVLTPHRYVSGQETALCDLIDGGPGRPTVSRTFLSGVGGRPTLVDNVETLAHVAVIARSGPAAYTGTSLVTLAGAVRHPGVREVEPGDSLRQLLIDVGSCRPRGVLIGGYYGRWISAEAVRIMRIDPATIGAGLIAVVDEASCAVSELARVAAWYAASSAGQCGACTWGLRDLAGATAAVHRGRRAEQAMADIRRWTPMVKGRGACRLPDGAATFLETGIEVFADEIGAHECDGACGRADNHLLPAPPQEAFR